MKKNLLVRSVWLVGLSLGLGASVYAQQGMLPQYPVQRMNPFTEPVLETNLPPVFETGGKTVKVPGKVQVFSYEGGQWMFESMATYAFTQEGLLEMVETESLDPESGKHRFERSWFDQYDEFGMSHLSIEEVSDDGADWRKELRIDASYDAVVPEVQLLQKINVWDDLLQEWRYDSESYYNWYKEILRDGQGRMLENRMWDSREKRYGYLSYTFEYGAKPHAENVFVLMDNRRCYSYENIEWHTCSDQHFWISNELIWGLYDGRDNRPNSYNVYELAEGKTKKQLGITNYWYDGNDRVEKQVYRDVTTQAVTQQRYDYKVQGKNCDVLYFDSWRDSNQDGEPGTGEEIWVRDATASLYDEHGNQTENRQYRMNEAGTYEFVRGSKYAHTYDADGVRLETVETVYNKKTGAYDLTQRIVLSDFVEIATGIDAAVSSGLDFSVEEDRICLASDGPLRYAFYTINGRCCRQGVASQVIELSGLERGLYVVRLWGKGGNASFKVVRK